MDVTSGSEVNEGQTAFHSLEDDADTSRFREGVGSPLVTAFCGGWSKAECRTWYRESNPRPCQVSVAVARRIELSEEEIAVIEQAALLHGVGKIGVSDSVLHEPGPLEEGEKELPQEQR